MALTKQIYDITTKELVEETDEILEKVMNQSEEGGVKLPLVYKFSESTYPGGFIEYVRWPQDDDCVLHIHLGDLRVGKTKINVVKALILNILNSKLSRLDFSADFLWSDAPVRISGVTIEISKLSEMPILQIEYIVSQIFTVLKSLDS